MSISSDKDFELPIQRDMPISGRRAGGGLRWWRPALALAVVFFVVHELAVRPAVVHSTRMYLELKRKPRDATTTPGSLVELPATSGEWPATVIWMHGLGSNAAGILSMAQAVHHMAPWTTWLLPTAYSKAISANNGAVAPAWFDVEKLDNGADEPLPTGEDEAGIRKSVARIHEIIESEMARGVESERIVIGGFSQGCAMAVLSLLSSPHQLGGMMCMSGWLPLANGTSHPMQNKHLKPAPVFWGHGQLDATVPAHWGRQARKFLEDAGYGHDIETHFYPKLPHWFDGDEVHAMTGWLFRRLPPKETSAEKIVQSTVV